MVPNFTVDELENRAYKIWGKYDYLPLEKVKEDFQKSNSDNPKVRAFKVLLQKYRPKQIEFEATKEQFSPYCIGYGNITSPIWFLGDSEGGLSNDIVGDDRLRHEAYNEKVRKLKVLSDENIERNVLITAYELLRNKYKLCLSDKKFNKYLNFRFATTIVNYSLSVESVAEKPDTEAGTLQFFTEYWRYRHRDLTVKHISLFDKYREDFLRDMDKILKPITIIAYPLKRSGTKERIQTCFGDRVIHLCDQDLKCIKNMAQIIPNLKTLKNKRPVLLTNFLGTGCFSYQNAKDLGTAMRDLW